MLYPKTGGTNLIKVEQHAIKFKRESESIFFNDPPPFPQPSIVADMVEKK